MIEKKKKEYINKNFIFGRLYNPLVYWFTPNVYSVFDVGYSYILIKYLELTYQAEEVVLTLKEDLFTCIKRCIEDNHSYSFKSKSFNTDIENLKYEYKEKKEIFHKMVFEMFDNLIIENLYIDKELVQQIFDDFCDNIANDLIELITKHFYNTDENKELFKKFVEEL